MSRSKLDETIKADLLYVLEQSEGLENVEIEARIGKMFGKRFSHITPSMYDRVRNKITKDFEEYNISDTKWTQEDTDRTLRKRVIRKHKKKTTEWTYKDKKFLERGNRQKPDVDNYHYDVRFTVSIEEPVEPVDEDELPSPDIIRNITRISKNVEGHLVELSRSENITSETTFVNYELEIEFIGGHNRDNITRYLSVIERLLKIVHATNYVFTRPERFALNKQTNRLLSLEIHKTILFK